MWKYIAVIITIICTSFYFFPFSFPFLLAVNTKMILAACSLPILITNLAMSRESIVSKNFFIISLFASGVSLASLISMTFNDTPDDTYFSYIVSMWVWLGGAYAVINLIKLVHGKVSLKLICHYLIAVCTIQCLLAIIIDNYPAAKNIAAAIYSDTDFFLTKKRLFGIGCGLDVAGGRFAAVLVMISFLLFRPVNQNQSDIYIPWLLISFFIIAIIGNMIGRTTTIGLILSVLIIIYGIIKGKEEDKKLIPWITVFSILSFLLFTFLYYTSPYWENYLKFGFEGFFSLVEKGEWEVHSNEMLQDGFIFPDNIKTWLIGDGYFGNTDIIDPYYVGKTWYGFYKGTDAGYSRFLFYFGALGLTAFSIFFIKSCQICMRFFGKYKYMFLTILFLNFIIWIKVSTDLFIVFGPFLCLAFINENNTKLELEE